MTDDAQRREVARRAAAVLACAQDQLVEAAREIERETGERVLRRRPVLADAGRGDLEALLAQVRAADVALSAALEWVGPRDRLGSVLKRMDSTVAAELVAKLRVAGLDE